MKRSIAPLAITALLLTGCGGGDVESEPAPSVTETTASPEPTPTPTPTTDPAKDEAEKQLEDALTQPEVDPIDALDPETSFLATYREQLQTLPDGPYAQLGTDIEAVDLGWQACSDLSVMSYGEALFGYAFSEATEEQVADYNAALNAAPGTLC